MNFSKALQATFRGGKLEPNLDDECSKIDATVDATFTIETSWLDCPDSMSALDATQFRGYDADRMVAFLTE